jgi:hypothetical protein
MIDDITKNGGNLSKYLEDNNMSVNDFACIIGKKPSDVAMAAENGNFKKFESLRKFLFE